MRRAIAAVVLALTFAGDAAAFTLGLLEPAGPRLRAAAARLDMAVAAAAPDGALTEDSAQGPILADWTRLSFLTWRAVARGATGVYFKTPSRPAGQEVCDYAEEWQAFSRLSTQLRRMRPVIDGGAATASPLGSGPGLEVRAWKHAARVYVLLVNVSGKDLPVDEEAFTDWRALFETRFDARQTLVACGGERCLRRDGALWLESRPFAQIQP